MQELDSNLFTLSETYLSLLKKRDVLMKQLSEIKQSDLAFEKGLVQQIFEIKKFAAYL